MLFFLDGFAATRLQAKHCDMCNRSRQDFRPPRSAGKAETLGEFRYKESLKSTPFEINSWRSNAQERAQDGLISQYDHDARGQTKEAYEPLPGESMLRITE